MLVNGEPENVDEARAKEILSEEEFEVKVEVGAGDGKATYWTCDFSYVSVFCSVTVSQSLMMSQRNM